MEKMRQYTESRFYVSDEAVAKVIIDAVESVNGVYSVSKSLAFPIKKLQCKKHSRIAVKFDGDVLSISVCVTLYSDAPALETSEKIQESVKSAVQNTLGMTVSKVNVSVCDTVMR
ncbi:MAG: Asp23/Gls24 family envelope stress response protein [Oscillospiraceae bacterium]